MAKTRKTATELKLPIRIGEKVRFKNEQGQLCESIPTSIDSITINNDRMQLTFSTKNSIYTNIEISTETTGIYQSLMPGSEISLGGNDYQKIATIYEVNEKGIIVASDNKIWLFTELKAGQ